MELNKNNDLKQLFAEYISECQYSSGRRPETIRNYKSVFRTFSVRMPHVTTTADLTPKVMNEFLKIVQVRKRIVGRNIEKVGVKASTIRTYWNKLNTFCIWLKLRGYIVDNPLEKIKTAEPVYDDNRALVRNEISKILAAIVLNPVNPLMSRRDTLMVTTLLYCGLRRTELISLEMRDIDIQKRILTVRGETSKSKRTRRLPIHPALIEQLDEYISERKKKGLKTQYLFASSNEDRGLSVHGLKHWVSRLSKLSGVSFHLHQFRHSFACALVKQGCHPVIIQKLLGHNDLRMTQRYLRSLGAEDYRDEVNMLNIDNFM